MVKKTQLFWQAKELASDNVILPAPHHGAAPHVVGYSLWLEQLLALWTLVAVVC
ncbi:unnamed protein product, partial [Adineta ricciae]